MHKYASSTYLKSLPIYSVGRGTRLMLLLANGNITNIFYISTGLLVYIIGRLDTLANMCVIVGTICC